MWKHLGSPSNHVTLSGSNSTPLCLCSAVIRCNLLQSKTLGSINGGVIYPLSLINSATLLTTTKKNGSRRHLTNQSSLLGVRAGFALATPKHQQTVLFGTHPSGRPLQEKHFQQEIFEQTLKQRRYRGSRSKFKGLLTALAILIVGGTGYVVIQTQFRNRNVFFPLYITPKVRRPVCQFSNIILGTENNPDGSPNRNSKLIIQEIECDDFVTGGSVHDKILHQLYSRIAVDETVSSIVGMPINKIETFEELEIKIVAKKYWVVGIQFLAAAASSPSAPNGINKDYRGDPLPPYFAARSIPGTHGSDTEKQESHSSQTSPHNSWYHFYCRKQVRAVRTESVTAFWKSVFGGDPPSSFGDNKTGGTGDGPKELNTIIQLEGEPPQNVGETGPSGDKRRGRRRRPGDKGIHGNGDNEDDHDEDEEDIHGRHKRNKKSKNSLEDLIKDEDQVQLVVSGVVNIHGPGGLRKSGETYHSHHYYDDENNTSLNTNNSNSKLNPIENNRAESDDKEEGLMKLLNNIINRENKEDNENESNSTSATYSDTKMKNSTTSNDGGPVQDARLEFVATKSLVPEEIGIRFRHTVLVYTDPKTGQTVRQRLW